MRNSLINGLCPMLIFLLCGLVFSTTLTANSLSIIDISDPKAQAFNPKICVDTLGNVVCLWNQSDNSYEIATSATKSIGQCSFSQSEAIALPGLKIANPHLVSGVHRDTIAIWQEFNGNHFVIQTTRKSFGKEWTTPIALSPEKLNAFDPQISAGSGGEVVAVWQLFDGSNHVIQSSTLIFDSEWTLPVQISPAGLSSTLAKIAINPTGLGIAIWRSDNEAGQVMVQASILTTEGSWQPPENITGLLLTETTIPQTKLGLSNSGEAIAAWVEDNGDGTSVIRTSIKSLNSNWTAPLTLSNVSGKAYDLQIAITRAGEAFVNWQFEMDGGKPIIQSRLKTRDGNWTPTINLSHPEGAARDHQIAMTPSGDAVAIWSFERIDEKSIVQYTIKKKNEDWKSPLNLSNAELNCSAPQLAIDPFHRISAVWQSENHYNTSFIQFADGISIEMPEPIPPQPPQPPPPLPPPPEIIMKPLPPNEFKGKVIGYKKNKGIRYMHVLNWKASQDPNVIEYKIYKNNRRIGKVSNQEPLVLVIKNIKKNANAKYSLVALDREGRKSEKLTLELNQF